MTLTCSFALLFLCSFNYGFSDQAFASTQATSAYARQFGDFNPRMKKFVLPALYLSLLNSLKAGTHLVGVFVGSWISKRYGRRWCISLLNIYAFGTTAVMVSGTNHAQMLTGRSMHYVYLGMQLSVIPIFLAEISPTHLRGSIGTLYWLSIKCGGLLITGIVRVTSRNEDNSAWQIPIGLIFVIPVIVISLIWLLPESPRWLLLDDNSDAALRSLLRLRQTRAEKHTPPSEAILTEFSNLSNAIRELPTKPSTVPRISHFLSILTPVNRRRTAIVVGLLFFQQSTGQSFASQYGTLFVKALHTVNPFSVTLGTNAVDIGGILLCMLLADRVGRRPILIVSSMFQTAALLTMGGLGAADASATAAKAGIVAVLLLYSFGWSFGYAPLAYVVAAELPSPHLREYTLRMGYTVKLVMEFVISFTYPYLEDADQANLGGRLGFIYGSIAFLAILFSVVFVPETRNIELEDMDAMSRSTTSPSSQEHVSTKT
ncbi:general substrate transporter [Cadophora sp. DSE1049]|nr:general substrate transporter [Cadophora sp. DSE1049]